MDRKLYLLGELGDRFGKEWSISGPSIKDAFRLVACQSPGFKEFLLSALDNNVDAAIMIGNRVIDDEKDVFMESHTGDIYVALVPCGSGKGWGKILAAIVIAVVAWQLGPAVGGLMGPTQSGAALGGFHGAISAGVQTALYTMAVNLALAGVAELLAKPPSFGEAEKDNKLFDGPQSTIKQGTPVPLLYGRLLISGTPISVSFDTFINTEHYGVMFDPTQYINGRFGSQSGAFFPILGHYTL